MQAVLIDLTPTMIRSLFNDFNRNARPYFQESAHETTFDTSSEFDLNFNRGDLGAFKGLSSPFSTESERFNEFWYKMHKSPRVFPSSSLKANAKAAASLRSCRGSTIKL